MDAVPVVLVPGFMQHGDAWRPVAERLGARAVTLDPRADDAPGRLAEIREATPPGAVLVGYSLGGRLALRAALHDPRRFAGLVLVGAHAGLEDPAERAARREGDEALAAWVEERPIAAVVARWEREPIFASQPPELVAAQRPGRLAHDPRALARLLRSAGQGAMAPVWDRLGALDVPVLLVAGALDRPYVEAHVRMAALLPRGRAVTVAGAGHAAHLERPVEVARLLEAFADAPRD